MRKAYGYVRCSGLGQMDGDGPIRQRAAIEQFAGLNEIEIVSWFEESHTGSDLDGRQVFREMRAALLGDGVRLVVVERLDRLARSIMVQETILVDFKKQEIELLSATAGEDGLCSDDPTRVLIRQILACFFEYERKMIVSKLRHARQSVKAQNGKCEGRKSYGEKPGEDVILRELQSRAGYGISAAAMAEDLNLRGIPTRGGKPWRASVIRKILKREVRNVVQSA